MTVRFAEYGTLDSKNFLRGQAPNRLLAPATMQRTSLSFFQLDIKKLDDIVLVAYFSQTAWRGVHVYPRSTSIDAGNVVRLQAISYHLDPP